MTLSNNELLQYVSGYLRHEEIDGYLSFSRFTEEQSKVLAERGFSPKENASSSMFVEFMTDGNEISFDYRISPGSSQKFYGIDVLVNGRTTACKFEQTDFTEESFSVKIKEQGEKKITIYFPNLAKILIKNLSVNGSIKRVERKLKYLALGDSITQGYCTKHPSLTYVNIVAENFNAYVLNQAIGGDIFYKDNLDESVNFAPDIITVAYGTNDWSQGVNLYTNAFEYFKRLRELYANTLIFALLPIYRDITAKPMSNNITLEDARLLIKKAAEKNGITVINAKDFIHHHEDFFCDKTLHPNELGFSFYGQNLYNELKKYM